MKIYYEKLITPVEQSYENNSTVENLIFLEDIIKKVSKDIYVQFKTLDSKQMNYLESNIILHGIIKTSNHSFFLNDSNSNNFITLSSLVDNFITIKIINSNLNLGTYKIHILLNDVFIEEHLITDLYSLYNRKFIKINSIKLGTSFTII